MKKLTHAFRKAFILAVFLQCWAFNLHATNYYFSALQGNDSRSPSEAQNPATPWQSINKLNSFFNQLNPGDAIFFKAGEAFYGSIIANKSGNQGAPISFGAYGGSEKPQITGFSSPTDWANTSSNVWETTLPTGQQSVGSVLVNADFKPAGRYPNAGTANSGYLIFESTSGNNSITDQQLSGSPNWTGGEVVIRKVRWVLDRNIITQHQGNTIKYISQSGYGASPGYGYFIQNHPQTLDLDGEWYYQAGSRKFGVYSTAGNPAARSTKVSTVQTLADVSRQSNISFSGIQFSGANADAFDVTSSQNISIVNCEILYSGHNAIYGINANNITVNNTIIYTTNNVALSMEGCNNLVIKNNTITRSGAFAGMGDGDSGGYEALLLSGYNQLVEGNTIDSTGYIAVTFRGDNVVVKNNVISNFSYVKDDGSGIYSWNNPNNPPVYTNRVIANNIVLNGLGAGAGTPDPDQAYANGIYMDDNAGGVEITGNTIANCANYGFYFHNAHDLVVKNNTVYNNKVQVNLTQDDIANSPIRNISMTGNTFVSKLVSQSVAEFKTNANDISSFGNFDYNYYSRPLYDNFQIGVLYRQNGNYIWNAYNLETWKTIYGKDQNSKKSPFPIAPFKVNAITGANQFTNGNFDNNINGLYSFSSANNATTSWNRNALSGGTLQVGFNNRAGGDSYATVVINVGAVYASKKYILKFSLRGTDEYKILDAFLRQSGGSSRDIGPRNYVSITGSRTEHELLLTPTFDEGSASIGFKIPEQNGPVYFDNVQLTEANVAITNPDDSIRFIYNSSTGSQSFPLNGSYADIANNNYASNITLAAYSSAVLLKKSSDQPPVEEVVCSATGSILREQWNNVSGNDVSDIPVQTAPSATSQLNLFESPTDVGNNYGARVRGYICPPQTGNYTFYLASDDASELWLSTNDDPASKIRIAYILGWTNPREWNKYPTQKSATIYLQAGRRYYIEALHKEGAGGDNLAVAWQLPNGNIEGPIPGSRLSPFSSAPQAAQTISFPAMQSKTVGDAPFTPIASASSGLPVTFTVVSGPATVSNNVVTLTAAGTVAIRASQAGNNAYAEATPVTQNLIVNPQNTSTCNSTGTILREQWDNIGGHNISSIPLQQIPDRSTQLTSFESPVDYADNYGTRIRGYICPPQTGNYTFYIAADDVAELWLSTDNSVAGKVKIASVPSWTYSREWNKYPSQKSASIYLQAGQQYYIEALHKEGEGGDNLAVAWQWPNGNMEAPIAGTRLSPAQSAPISACSGTGSILREQWNQVNGHSINSIPLHKVPDISQQLSTFEAATDVADNYGARIRGYICAPQTGKYTFYIAADDVAELWLSTTDNESNEVQIASVPSWTYPREWNKYSSQKSVDIYLQAGQRYYIEALHKEGEGGDNLSVAWQLPNGTLEAPIAGSRLSPYESTASAAYATVSVANSMEISIDTNTDKLDIFTSQQLELLVFPNPFKTTATIQLQVQDDGNTRLELLNEQGIIVKQLFNGLAVKGQRKFALNAANLSGGLYIVRLTTKTKVLSQKVILLR